jgi:hypothetical protein
VIGVVAANPDLTGAPADPEFRGCEAEALHHIDDLRLLLKSLAGDIRASSHTAGEDRERACPEGACHQTTIQADVEDSAPDSPALIPHRGIVSLTAMSGSGQ